MPWAQVKEITAEGARVGILFKPEFAKFLLRIEDGSQIEIRTYNAMTEREMKEWARRMRERKQAHDTAASGHSLRPDAPRFNARKAIRRKKKGSGSDALPFVICS